MNRLNQGFLIAALAAAVIVATGPRAFMQADFAGTDFTGYWNQNHHEDGRERGAGPDEGDYTGLPMNAASRLRAQSWTASQYTQVGWLCRNHATGEIIRSPQDVMIWRDVDPTTRETVAWVYEWRRNYEQRTPIWLDDRPAPSKNDLYTNMGFHKGKMIGERLHMTITNLKEAYQRRNGVPRSDLQRISQHFLRRDNFLTIVAFTYDPVYFDAPMVQSSDFDLIPGAGQVSPSFPCFEARETTREIADVPHNLPGTNTASQVFADKFNLPLEAVMGGSETLYPEYRTKIKAWRTAQSSSAQIGRRQNEAQ
jgi:hypothetical protein